MINDLKNCILNSEIKVKVPKYEPITGEITYKSIIFNEEVKKSSEEGIKISKLLEDHILYQLKILFANLKENIKQFSFPTNFISSIKGYDNQSINVHIQQDVNEFFNLVCDKLEDHLKG